MKEKMLVVDNHRMMKTFMAALLEKEGFEVQTAQDGISAIDVLKTFYPDVIFIDLIIPNISGEKLCKIVRSMPQVKDAFVVILSSVAAEGKFDFTEFGADACIAKGPIDKMSAHVLTLLEKWKKGDLSEFAHKVIGVEDIHKREVVKELLSTRNHLQVIIENKIEGILELTADGKIIYANPVAISLSGIKEEKLLGSYFTDLFGENHLKGVKDLFVPAADPINAISDNLSVAINGRKVLLNIIPIKDQGGNSFIVILNAASERKQAQQRLYLSEKQCGRLVEISPHTILLHHKGKLQYVNSAGVKLFGASGSQEMIGRPYADLVHPDDRAGFKKHMRRLVKERQVTPFREHRLITLNDRVINVESTDTAFKEQNKIMIQTVIHDITERKKAETALTESERRYRNLMDMIPDAVVVWADERIVFANPAAVKMIGATGPDKLMGKSYWKIVHPDYHAVSRKRMDLLHQDEQILPVEVKFIRLDGKTVICECTGKSITFNGWPALLEVWHEKANLDKSG
ncbi:MAG: PAS domain S-box protein [Thermodesulfobacteriota bacterium]|nr:PAS domain S-box protein [Thermodesulfobacteriota bacterium]